MSNKSTQQIPQFLSNIEPNTHLLHLLVLRQLNNNRAGTASTKTRGEVMGGGKKPWRQKGTGRARVGSIRSPLWVGGGITFGPKPRSYYTDLPRKERSLAIAQAITSRSDDLVGLKRLPEVKDCKTKIFLGILRSYDLTKGPILLISSSSEAHFNEVKRSSNNLSFVVLKDQRYVGVFDILRAKTVVITEYAMKELEKRFSK